MGTPSSSSSCSRRDRDPQVKSENSRKKMANNPYSNLSEEVQSALANLNSDDSRYQPQNAHELFKLDQASRSSLSPSMDMSAPSLPPKRSASSNSPRPQRTPAMSSFKLVDGPSLLSLEHRRASKQRTVPSCSPTSTASSRATAWGWSWS